MKKTGWMIPVVFLLLVIGCSGDDDGPEPTGDPLLEKIAGTWERDFLGQFITTIEYHADGSFKRTHTYGGNTLPIPRTIEISGSFGIEDSILTEQDLDLTGVDTSNIDSTYGSITGFSQTYPNVARIDFSGDTLLFVFAEKLEPETPGQSNLCWVRGSGNIGRCMVCWIRGRWILSRVGSSRSIHLSRAAIRSITQANRLMVRRFPEQCDNGGSFTRAIFCHLTHRVRSETALLDLRTDSCIVVHSKTVVSSCGLLPPQHIRKNQRRHNRGIAFDNKFRSLHTQFFPRNLLIGYGA